MIQIGITGHQNLEDESLWVWVSQEIRTILKEYRAFNGFSSLAIGADQLFAKLVLGLGCNLIGIIPFKGYDRVYSDSDKEDYFKLLSSCEVTVILPEMKSDEESYFLAGKTVVESADILIAVWDGKKAKGLGGTGDAVEYAKSLGKKVFHISPESKVTREI